jgi:hypothetical protein
MKSVALGVSQWVVWAGAFLRATIHIERRFEKKTTRSAAGR